MFDSQHAQFLADEIALITEKMTNIAEQQRQDILTHRMNGPARVDAVLHGVMATQNQLIALVSVLSVSFIEHLRDQDEQQQLGLSQ